MKDRQFIVLGHNLVDNDKYRKLMTKRKGMEMTYQWLWRHIVRAPMRNIYKHEVYNKYFVEGKLATTMSEEKMAKDLFISRNTLRLNLKDLEEAKVIKIKTLATVSRGENQRPQKVYILGKWHNELNTTGEEITKEYRDIFELLIDDRVFTNV